MITKTEINKDLLSFELTEMKYVFEKSIVAKRDLKKGQVLTLEDLAFKKPGGGIKPASYKNLIGKKVTKDLKLDDKIMISDLF